MTKSPNHDTLREQEEEERDSEHNLINSMPVFSCHVWVKQQLFFYIIKVISYVKNNKFLCSNSVDGA